MTNKEKDTILFNAVGWLTACCKRTDRNKLAAPCRELINEYETLDYVGTSTNLFNIAQNIFKKNDKL